MKFKMMMVATVAGMVFAASSPSLAQTDAVEQPAGQVSAVSSQVPDGPEGAGVSVAPLADGVADIVAVEAPEPVTAAEMMIPEPETVIEQEISDQLSFQPPVVNVNKMSSLFFTVWEHDLILDARRGLTTRMPGSDDGVTTTGPRDISLGGIVYRSAKEWTIWLNNLRVAPNAIPEEVIDLKVHKDYIEIEWFDSSTNQIFPIRLRAHQRFNLDTRMFLPG